VSLHEKLTTMKAMGPEPGGNGSRRKLLNDINRKIHHLLIEELGPQLYSDTVSRDEVRAIVQRKLTDLVAGEATPLSGEEKTMLIEEISDDVLGYGPLERFLKDDEVTEVMVNDYASIYIEKAGHLHKTEDRFIDEDHLRRTIDKIVGQVGRRIDEGAPMVDARLPDGSRVNAVIPPISVHGSKLTIRKFAADPYTADDLIAFGSFTPQIASFLEACVRGRLNVIVSGGTGSGKTTTLNVLSKFIPDDERIITIEDSVELQIHQEHVLQMESRPPNIEGRGQVTIRDLVRNALRMRPDRIVVGEVRGGEALDMLQAMNTGHDGSLSTVHANAPRDVLSRLETMVLMSGMDLPVRAIREQVASALDLIVHQARFRDGSRRITHITEVQGMEGDVIILQDLFLFDYSQGFDENGRQLGCIKSTGIRPKFSKRLAELGIEFGPEIFQFEYLARK
jgi:pilus assembly protein CpaF